MNKQLTLSLSILLSFLTNALWGQQFDPNLDFGDSTQTHRLLTGKDDVIFGHAISLKNTTLSFLFNNKDTLRFQLHDIKSLTVYDPANPVSSEEHNEFKVTVTYEPNQEEEEEEEEEIRGIEYVFFSPTAYNLGKKKGEFRNTAVLVNSINYGLTDYLSVGGDISTSITRYLLSLKIKASYPLTGFLRVGAGARVHLTSGGFDDSVDSDFISYYGIITAGNKDRFINFSLGNINKKNLVLMEGTYLSVGLSWRISNHWKLLADTFFSGVGEELIEVQNFQLSNFNRRQPATYVFLGTSHMKGRHLFNFGLEIIESFFIFNRTRKFRPMAGYQLYF